MKHAHYRHRPSPFFIFAIGMLFFWMFGFKLFIFLPFLFLFGAFGWGMCGNADWSDEKPKRKGKPKRDEYIVMDDEDDVTYL